jgi:hypothetical protein
MADVYYAGVFPSGSGCLYAGRLRTVERGHRLENTLLAGRIPFDHGKVGIALSDGRVQGGTAGAGDGMCLGGVEWQPHSACTIEWRTEISI